MPGPNDFHIKGGAFLQGLGDDEPDEKARVAILESTARDREREERIATAQAAVEREAAELDDRETYLAEREAKFAQRLKELEEREEELTSPAGGRRGK